MQHLTDAQGLALFQWQQSRRRPDFMAGSQPTQGFGTAPEWFPAGIGSGGIQITLWLPPPRSEERRVFVNGRAQVQQLPGLVDDSPDVETVRDAVLSSLESVGPGMLRAPVLFLDYAAAIVRRNYNVTDDELAVLLSGDDWNPPVVRHLLGGPRAITQMLAAKSVLLQPYSADYGWRDDAPALPTLPDPAAAEPAGLPAADPEPTPAPVGALMPRHATPDPRPPGRFRRALAYVLHRIGRRIDGLH